MEWRGEESENAQHLGEEAGLGGSLSLVPRGSGVTCWGWEGGGRLESGRKETRGGRGKQGRGTEVVRKTRKEIKDQERAETETGRGRDEGDQEKETERKKQERQRSREKYTIREGQKERKNQGRESGPRKGERRDTN